MRKTATILVVLHLLGCARGTPLANMHVDEGIVRFTPDDVYSFLLDV